MNIKKMMVCGALLTVVGGIADSQIASAATYPDATHATSNGIVEFIKGKPEIDNPDDPNKPIVPEKPVNPSDADLMIQYVSDFDFGKHVNDTKAVKAYAKPDMVKAQDEEGNATGEAYAVSSFVSTKDLRGTRTGWELSVTPSVFKTSGGTELKGAGVTLRDLKYNYTDEAGKPTPTTGDVVLNPGTEISVAKANATQGIGSWSLAMGDLNSDKTEVSGVELNVPKNTGKDSDTVYTAEFNWELKADPTVQ